MTTTTTKVRLPEIWAVCELCELERAGHPPEMVSWSQTRQAWLCSDCWFDLDTDERTVPLVFAKDALDDTDTMERRMIAVMTARRMGAR